MSITLKQWHAAALELRKLGQSSRKIAKDLGIGKSTVNDFFKRKFERGGSEALELALTTKSGPRIFVYDIETAPIMAHVWKLWDNNVGLNQIQSDWFIMSFCGKWLGEDEIFYFDQRDAENQEDDSYLLSKLWSFLNEADIVIGQNIKRFDTKKVNARFILNGFPKPSTYRQIDTMVIAKEQFGFTSNKLEYLSNKLCPEHVKDGHIEFPGHTLWVECLKGNRAAWEAMEAYNRDDVLATEALYNMLSSWDNKLPNFDVYVDEVLDMSEWVHDGYHTTNLAKYKRYRNIKTGVQRRSRVNELSKEKRQQLLANI
jgi:hypothetical protein